MNSAAKLRNRRVIATAAATALVATAFGPAAMAWETPGGSPARSSANQADIASFGLIDADRREAGTQGYTSVLPDTNNQLLGDMRFVFPGTWSIGDKLDFKVTDSASSPASQPFASTPTVNIDEKAYAPTTHVALTSGDDIEGNVEDGREAPYEGTGTPVAPTFTTAVAGEVLTVTFTNSASTNAKDAKFIGAINGARINTTTAAEGDIKVAMTDPVGDLGTDPAAVVAYPATVVGGSLAVENGAVVSDGSPQFVGPITINGPQDGAEHIKITMSGGKFDRDVRPTVRAYNQAGDSVSAPAFGFSSDNTALEASSAASTSAVRVVVSGLAVRSSSSAMSYQLTNDGVTGTPETSAVLGSGDANRSQTDIKRLSGGVPTVRVNNTSATSDRLGGIDRYETATRVAASSLATDPYNPQVPQGESDTVVIASGENYADALSAGYLTATQDATLILTQKGQLSWAAENYLRTYGAKKVFIIGGEAAVSPAVEEKLRSLPAYDVQDASNAGSTTKEITYTAYFGNAKSAFSGAAAVDTTVTASVSGLNVSPVIGEQSVTIARVNNAAPSVSGTPSIDASAAVDSTSLPTAVDTGAAFDLKINYSGVPVTVRVPAVTVTGTAQNQVITFDLTRVTTQETTKPSDNSTDSAKTVTGQNRRVAQTGSNLQVIRLAGENRFVTNRNVNEYALRNASMGVGTTNPVFGQPAKRTAVVANGLTPWDALASGPLVGDKQVATNQPKPIILTMGNELEGQAKGQLSSLGIQHAILVGGNAVIPEAAEKDLTDRGVSSARLAGANRWETAKAVGDFLLKSRSGSTRNVNPGFGFVAHSPYLVNGGVVAGAPDSTKWADALVIGPVAAGKSRVVSLTDSATLPEATEKFYTEQAHVLEAVIPVGGVNVVSNAVVEAANKLALAK